jgi:pyrroloquinoline quinone biosynthesis protein B
MRVRILGSAAGGGLPQWNCRCANCEAARAGSPDVQPRTQSSVAVSADGSRWFLLNVSPDVRQQILAFPSLGPPRGETRGTALAGCVLTDAEIDHVTGLLHLREGCILRILSTPLVRRWLNQYLPVEPVLRRFAERPWIDLPLDTPLELPSLDGTPSRLRLLAFEVDRHVPRFVPESPAEAVGSVVGLHIEDTRTRGKLVYAPCLASIAEPLRAAAKDANCLLIDGTFWDDSEPIRSGIGDRTARQMGHLPVSDPQGSLDWFSGLPARHRVYIHINNTNPMLNRGGPEHHLVEAAGVRVGADGDLFDV